MHITKRYVIPALDLGFSFLRAGLRLPANLHLTWIGFGGGQIQIYQGFHLA